MNKLFILMLLVLTGCKSAKNIQTQTTEVKSVFNTDSLVRVTTDSISKVYQEALKELSADVIFQDCDTLYRDTGSVKMINTVRYIPGKGIEASGQIKSFRLKESELLKKLDSMVIEYESESRLRTTAEENLKIEQSKKVVKRKTGFLWWLIIGVVVGMAVESKFKLFNKIKLLLTKI